MIKTIQPTSSSNSFHKIGHDMLFYPQNNVKYQKQRKSKSYYQSSLPHISPFNEDLKNIKINRIRKQSENTEEQITLMKARLHAMKQLKKKIELKKQKSLQKGDFIQTVRQRKHFESLQKLQEIHKKNQQLQDLKEKAKQLREGMKKQIQKAKQSLYMKNITSAYEKKSMQVGYSEQSIKKRQRQQEEKATKINKIKEQQQKHTQILREFQRSRIIQSKKNRVSRIEKQLKQKLTKQKSLEKLRKQHQQFIEELKSAEKQYEETVQKINPETQYLGKGSRVSLIDKMIF